MKHGTSIVRENWNRFLVHFAAVERYIRRRVRDTLDAEDVLQELALHVLRTEAQPSGPGSVTSFYIGMARYVLFRHLRDRQRRGVLYERVLAEASVSSQVDGPDFERDCAARENLELALQGIDPHSFRLLIDRYLLGQSAGEIGRVAQSSPEAVRMRLMRVRSSVLSRIHEE